MKRWQVGDSKPVVATVVNSYEVSHGILAQDGISSPPTGLNIHGWAMYVQN